MTAILSLVAIQVFCSGLVFFSLERATAYSSNPGGWKFFLCTATALGGLYVTLFSGYLLADLFDVLLRTSALARTIFNFIASIACMYAAALASLAVLKKFKLIR